MHLPSLISLFFIFLFGPLRSTSQNNSHYKDCAPYPFKCGNLGNISFPFLAGDRPQICGYPGFVLTCENNSPVIEIEPAKYRVKEINYTERVMSIAPTSYDNDSCPRPSRDSRIDAATEFDFPDKDGSGILTLHYDCSREIRDPGLHEIPCLRDFFKGPSYFGSMANYRGKRMWGGHCHDPVNVRVRRGALDRLKENMSVYAEIVKEGFEVEWIVGTGLLCTGCVRSGGICGYNHSSEEPACICPERTHYAPCSAAEELQQAQGEEGDKARKLDKIIINSLAGVAGLCFLLAVSMFMIKKKMFQERMLFWRNALNTSHNVEAFLENYGSLSPKRYSYSDIKKITGSFKYKLGQGGFGGVYKGKLADGSLVAVKLLIETKGNGEEFINEVGSIGRTSHVNVVNLMGFCSEGSKRALVYEFMPNGSLEKFIYLDSKAPTSPHLGWEKLDQIAVGIARGLEYLHRGCSTRILHFDIKPHNILLDKDFCPKISDFGMAKLCPTRDSIISMQGPRGTAGYIAPEVFSRNFGGVSHKSDVYSYGMMVLEMVGGRRNIDAEVDNSSEIYFPDWIFNRLDHLSIGLLFDQEIATEEQLVQARKMILVGIWCIQTNPASRPSISRVLEMLEGSLEAIQVPPKPYLYSPPRSPGRQASSSTSTQ